MIFVLAGATAGSGLSGCSTSNTPSAGTAAPAHRNHSPAAVVRGAAVTMTAIPLVDTARTVVSGGKVLAGQRNLATTVWSPAGVGPFPLVVFVHGYDVGPLAFQRFCSTLASDGYVVAAPSFPLADPAQGFPLDETHLVDEAADVAFVITSLEQDATIRVDRSQVAVVGHSDGGDVALLVGYGRGTVDPRVGAVVASAPDRMTVAPVASHVPLLLVQGTADPVVPYSSSQSVYSQIDTPVSYLSLVGADHATPIVGPSPWTPVLDDSVATFLDATVARRGTGTSSLAATLSTSPLVTFESKS
jgi:dienelactone hydrolase